MTTDENNTKKNKLVNHSIDFVGNISYYIHRLFLWLAIIAGVVAFLIFVLTLIGAVVYLGYLILQGILEQEDIITKAFWISIFACVVSGFICFAFYKVVERLNDLYENRNKGYNEIKEK